MRWGLDLTVSGTQQQRWGLTEMGIKTAPLNYHFKRLYSPWMWSLMEKSEETGWGNKLLKSFLVLRYGRENIGRNVWLWTCCCFVWSFMTQNLQTENTDSPKMARLQDSYPKQMLKFLKKIVIKLYRIPTQKPLITSTSGYWEVWLPLVAAELEPSCRQPDSLQQTLLNGGSQAGKMA